jgi:hypothetical protein
MNMRAACNRAETLARLGDSGPESEGSTLKIGCSQADDQNMNSFSDEPIKLSSSETELLKRALLEAQEQAEAPMCAESETQFLRRATGEAGVKTGNTRQFQRGTGKLVL